jgi:hypothetical protein
VRPNARYSLALASRLPTLAPPAVRPNARYSLALASRLPTLAPPAVRPNARYSLALASRLPTLAPPAVRPNARYSLALASRLPTLAPPAVRQALAGGSWVRTASHPFRRPPHGPRPVRWDPGRAEWMGAGLPRLGAERAVFGCEWSLPGWELCGLGSARTNRCGRIEGIPVFLRSVLWEICHDGVF